MSVKPPKPQTRSAILVSEGIVEPTATLHHYHETRSTTFYKPLLREVDASTKPDGTEGPVWEYMFRCSKTGKVRRWGLTSMDRVIS